MVKLYKVLTFLLQPVGYILLMMCVSSLVMSGFNPQMLLGGFFGISIFIYIFLCFRFIAKVIIANQSVTHKLKDWIKVNSYVTFIQGVLVLLLTVFIFTLPKDAFNQLFQTMYDMLQTQNPGGQMLSFPVFVKAMSTSFSIIGIVDFILVIHVFLTWKILKQYKEYFSE